jgi:hypothetical protein
MLGFLLSFWENPSSVVLNQPSISSFCGVPLSQHSLLMAQWSSGFTHYFLMHSISSTQSSLVPLNTTTKPFVGLLLNYPLPTIFIVDPGFISSRVPTKPKTITPSSKLEGNTVHKMHYVVSPKIALNGWLQDSGVYSLGLSMRYGVCILNHLL